MKTVVIGDIHGCYDEMLRLFSLLENECDIQKDRIIFLGDYIDRGPDSKKVVDFVRNLTQDNFRVKALMGNHERMLIQYFEGSDSGWNSNGSYYTIESFGGLSEVSQYLNWFRALYKYYEDDDNIYVHAGIQPYLPLSEQDIDYLVWIREPFINSAESFEKRVIFGHTPSQYINGGNQPYTTYAGNLCLDTGCVYDGKLSALIINEDKSEHIIQV